jgi:hypothetical protein
VSLTRCGLQRTTNGGVADGRYRVGSFTNQSLNEQNDDPEGGEFPTSIWILEEEPKLTSAVRSINPTKTLACALPKLKLTLIFSPLLAT